MFLRVQGVVRFRGAACLRNGTILPGRRVTVAGGGGTIRFFLASFCMFPVPFSGYAAGSVILTIDQPHYHESTTRRRAQQSASSGSRDGTTNSALNCSAQPTTFLFLIFFPTRLTLVSISFSSYKCRSRIELNPRHHCDSPVVDCDCVVLLLLNKVCARLTD